MMPNITADDCRREMWIDPFSTHDSLLHNCSHGLSYIRQGHQLKGDTQGDSPDRYMVSEDLSNDTDGGDLVWCCGFPSSVHYPLPRNYKGSGRVSQRANSPLAFTRLPWIARSRP